MSNGISKTDLNLIPAGYKQTEVGVIPEDWDVIQLGDCASYVGSGKTNTKSRGEYPLYGSTGLIGSCELPEYSGESLLVARVGANAGRLNYVYGEYGVSDNTILIKIKPTNNISFFKYWLIRKNLNTLVFGSGQPLITGTQLKELYLPLPSNTEQTAIANALSDVDLLISELDKLIAKKQAIKTATMQQLLTGRTRLPQFALREDGSKKGNKQSELGEIPEDWEVVNIGELGQVDPENLGATTSPDYEFNYISLEQIEKGVIKNTTRSIFKNAPSRARRVLKKGDILVSTVRPNLMSHYFIQNEVNDLICSTGFSVIRFFEEKLSPGYLYQHLFSSVINNQIEMLISGSNYPAINSGNVKQLKVQIGSVKEQTAIATILSDMDKEIQVLEQRLNKTRKIKQGMMQELLTGKTRLVQPSPTDVCHVD
ncbi:TPA: restriction endonuclease subunit S [Proteus mirabilis]|uniref:restriction endonuclease subunit S n=1 Tax=Proteus mirabilis TaxID=584 RepID=UPI000CECC115|nr:restriction endonuclease subunit S [Proteus mirabilis]MDF7326273.1 restriction endonuclease subunit S [Proteus mirabilis]MDU1884758.1 restriction endonuclease subunit S [Proteus mirabilis]ROD54228.1 restriction endonuclease subunit S [Proteus mirabilis]HCT6309601.1 restriction endonuclease subunit S [Proteus mirabilis]HDU8445030.1 restriction endonuclease subunit S [Proteus mirabilis]